MKPERIQNNLTEAKEPPTWATEAAKVSKTFDFGSQAEALDFAAFVRHQVVRGGASAIAYGSRAQELSVEVTPAHDTALTDAEYQLTQAIDRAYDLFMGP